MLERISGKLVTVDDACAIVLSERLGMCFRVHVPAYHIDALQRLEASEILTLHTLLQLEPNGKSGALAPRLIGFPSETDRAFFELFTTVKGVGGKRALRAMVKSPRVLASYIAQRDADSLQQLPEIGKRLAETIVAELHGKVDRFVDVVMEASAASSPMLQEACKQAVEALVRLGETKSEAQQRITLVIQKHPALHSAESILAAAFESGGG